jgi:hypothetical protein
LTVFKFPLNLVLDNNPFDIVTILIGNGDFVEIDDFKASLENSGLSKLAYVPENTIAYNE